MTLFGCRQNSIWQTQGFFLNLPWGPSNSTQPFWKSSPFHHTTYLGVCYSRVCSTGINGAKRRKIEATYTSLRMWQWQSEPTSHPALENLCKEMNWGKQDISSLDFYLPKCYFLVNKTRECIMKPKELPCALGWGEFLQISLKLSASRALYFLSSEWCI